MWVTPTSPKILLGHQSSSTLVGGRFFPMMETEYSRSMKAPFLVHPWPPLLCYVKDQWNLTHCFSISGESYCQTVEMCKKRLWRRKEWSGCLVQQRVLGDNSCWAPKSCFSLVLWFTVNLGHGSNGIFYSHSLKSKSSSLFVLRINRTRCSLCLV